MTKATSLNPLCPSCGKSLLRQPRCSGHDKANSSNENKDTDIGGRSLENIPTHINAKTGFVSEHAPIDNTFNPEVISDLIEKNMLVFENNQGSGILSIRVVNPSLLTQTQRAEVNKYVNSILSELDAFKAAHGIKDSCKSISQDARGIYSLLITLPNPVLFDAFIKRLVNMNLLQASLINNNNLTPFSKRPTPGQQKKKVDEDEEGRKNPSKKSPFKSKLKPDGWEIN